MIHTRILQAQWLYSFIFILTAFTASSQSDVSMLFVGDVMQHDGQIEAAYNKTTNSYEYEDGFKFVKPIINKYDIAVANLEVTLAGKPYKGYPQFSAPDELAETIVHSGFNVILTANNHSCDRGSKGVLRTLDKLDELGVAHTGTFRNKEERDKNYPLIVEKKGIKIAMLNYTYGTNGLEVAKPLIINYIDSTVIKADVAKAKERGADYIVCNMHWGKEYKLLPNSYQKKYEQLCYRIGVNMVIGGHPHVVQPIEKKTVNGEEKLTVWSLGNFVSNMQTRPTRGGLMVGATISRHDKKIELESAEYYLVYVLKRSEGEVTQYYILPDYDYNSHRKGFLDSKNLTHYKNFFADSRKLFAEHNKGVEECILTVPTYDNTCTQLWNCYLEEYYSVLVSENNDAVLNDKNLGPYMHEHVDMDGNAYILSGICSSKTQAEGNLHFIQDCGFDAKLVLVKPQTVSIVVE
jgi:poly-gamma-glutamate synthesis protein (capsule biosynthesis protein)